MGVCMYKFITEKDMCRVDHAFGVPRDCCDAYLVPFVLIAPKLQLFNIKATLIISVREKHEDH